MSHLFLGGAKSEGMSDTTSVGKRFKQLSPYFDERLRRLWAAAEADALGFGGAVAVERSTGVSRRAISVGHRELEAGPVGAGVPRSGRVRSPGGGRKKSTDKNPKLLGTLLALVEPGTRGDPENPLRWTSKSVRHLAAELKAQGLRASHQLVAELLQREGYSLQANVKTREGGTHPDRNAQFEYINERIRQMQAQSQPVISVAGPIYEGAN